MNKGIKYALVFMGGTVVGFGVCGLKVLEYALNDEDIRNCYKDKISNKITTALYGDSKEFSSTSYRSYKYKKLPDNIVFDSHLNAEQVLYKMEDILDCYGSVSIQDMYDLCDLPGNYTYNKYGWTNLRDAKVVRVRNGYKIDLPKPLSL